MEGNLHLPVVDLASPDLRAAAEAIRQVTSLDPPDFRNRTPRKRLRAYLMAGQACVEHGFFYVTNHGVDRGLLEAVFAQSKGLFDLPMEEKMALLRSANHRGYTPPYAEKLDASSQFVGRVSLPSPAPPLHTHLVLGFWSQHQNMTAVA